MFLCRLAIRCVTFEVQVSPEFSKASGEAPLLHAKTFMPDLAFSPFSAACQPMVYHCLFIVYSNDAVFGRGISFGSKLISRCCCSSSRFCWAQRGYWSWAPASLKASVGTCPSDVRSSGFLPPLRRWRKSVSGSEVGYSPAEEVCESLRLAQGNLGAGGQAPEVATTIVSLYTEIGLPISSLLVAGQCFP